MRRVIRVGDQEMAKDVPFPFGVYAVKVERMWSWDEETKIGIGSDQYIPVEDQPVFIVPPDDESQGVVTTVKWIIWPLPEYMAWQDDGGC